MFTAAFLPIQIIAEVEESQGASLDSALALLPRSRLAYLHGLCGSTPCRTAASTSCSCGCPRMRRHFTSPLWMTYRQAAELGGQVRRGETGAGWLYADTFTRHEAGDNGEEHAIAVPDFLKSYCFFPFSIPTRSTVSPRRRIYAQAAQPPTTTERIEKADRFFANTAADIRHGGNAPYYVPAPGFRANAVLREFRQGRGSYTPSTLAQEITHWTKHTSALSANFGRQHFGDHGYAMEELVAEMGAAFLCADLSLTPPNS